MSNEEQWWPGLDQNPPNQFPSFQVRRSAYGSITGGDYVRGSTVATLPNAILRRQTSDPEVTAEVEGKGLLHARPLDHTTARVSWAWPSRIYEESSWDVVLVRSSFGIPTTPNDGMVVMAGNNQGFFPQETSFLGLWEVASAAPGSGELYLDGTDLDISSTDYESNDVSDELDDLEEGGLVIITSGMEARTQVTIDTVNGTGDLVVGNESLSRELIEGEVVKVYASDPSSRPNLETRGTNTIDDSLLPSGRWYYYALFFRLASQPLNWIRGFTDSVQIPRDFRHAEHLWQGLPPYYRYVDEQQRTDDGPLKQFLAIPGFELDYTRQSAEFIQDMHHVDFSPIPLLREVGKNHGQNYEQGLGDIRFRALMANLPERLLSRGTKVALRVSLETMSQYRTAVTTGGNMMLMSDDADPFFSTGSWAGPHPDYDFSSVGTPETYSNYTIEIPATIDALPSSGGRSFLRADSSDEGPILITNGCGQVADDSKEFLPITTGIAVVPGATYGVAAWLRVSAETMTPNLVMLWFGKDGTPTDSVAITEGTPPPADDTWDTRYLVEAVAPPNAFFLVPGVWCPDRTDETLDLSSMVVYQISPSDTPTVLTPDQLLTVGDPDELMGAPDPLNSFPGHAMGEPGGTT